MIPGTDFGFSAALGLQRSTQPSSKWGSLFYPTLCHPRDELLGKLEEVLTLFLFTSYVLIFTFLSVENSVKGSWGLYPLK